MFPGTEYCSLAEGSNNLKALKLLKMQYQASPIPGLSIILLEHKRSLRYHTHLQ